MALMAASPCIQCRVTSETKLGLRALAGRQGLTQSALLKRLVETALQIAGSSDVAIGAPIEPAGRDARVYVRLRPDDHVLLRERAATRGMASATYVSILVRAHLRALTPLPDRELAELKRSLAEVGFIGRNLNQLARVANQTGHVAGPNVAELRSMLRALEGLRDHFKGLIIANLKSWETGHVPSSR